MPLLFAVTLFVSASLLFMVQPMVGKMILPLLGGSPAVWNACMVFFQALLLLGYLYAHHVSTKYSPKRQWALHTIVLLVPVLAMVLAVALSPKHSPIAVAESLAPSGDTSPFLAVMALMSVAIGIPFFVASTSAPLLQKWFAYTGHPSSSDPYYLYAASNVGSLISLLGYPLFIEPNLTVNEQAWLFAAGFAILFVLIMLCGRAAANPIGVPPIAERQPSGKNDSTLEIEPPPSALRVAKWIVLAFVPSSWMLGVTFYMTTDIASIPLLWVVPLALYLVTFIIAFGRVPAWFRQVIGNLAPVMILLLVFVKVSGVVSGRPAIALMLHIMTFFAVSLMCHYELVRDRPKDVTHLTKFYLMMSVGGVLGGLFNALIAPLLFALAYEYDIVIVVGCLMVPVLIERITPASPELAAFKRKITLGLNFLLPALTGFFFWLLVSVVSQREFFSKMIKWIVAHAPVSDNTVVAILVYAVPVMACFFYVDRPFRFALAVAVLLGIHTYRDQDTDVVYTERTFFGILKVEERGVFTRLVHGTTLHGTQINAKWQLHKADVTQALGALSTWDTLAIQGTLANFDPRQEPLTYYHRTGPVGAMFHELRTRKNGADAKAHVAMVGLGTGSASCYALPGQKLDFYEIDIGVRRLVADRDDFFTYVRDARNRGATLDIHMGDARLKLKELTDRKYALLLVDAFSSDAIPVHLLTKEAVELYLDRMTEDGILALHISNKYVRLGPVVAKIAEELGLATRVWSDDWAPREDLPEDHRHHPPPPGKTASSWVVLAKSEKILGTLALPATEQVLAFGVKNQTLVDLLKEYGPNKNAKEAMMARYGNDFPRGVAGGDPDAKGGGLAIDDFKEKYGRQAAVLALYVRRVELTKNTLTLGELTSYVYDDMFSPLRVIPDVPLWTDDYSDVLRVMMLKEVQTVRRFFGLPTPVKE